MRWFDRGSRSTVLEELRTPRPVPVGISLPAEPSTAELDEYKAVVARLGLASTDWRKTDLLCALRAHDYKLFPFEPVVAFLNQEYKSQKQKWFWRALTYADKTRTAFQPWASAKVPEDNGRSFVSGPYQKLIPLPILLHIEKIREMAPEAGIFISDELSASDVKDPFLALSLPGLNEMLVVLCWDEPGFGFQKHA